MKNHISKITRSYSPENIKKLLASGFDLAVDKEGEVKTKTVGANTFEMIDFGQIETPKPTTIEELLSLEGLDESKVVQLAFRTYCTNRINVEVSKNEISAGIITEATKKITKAAKQLHAILLKATAEISEDGNPIMAGVEYTLEICADKVRAENASN